MKQKDILINTVMLEVIRSEDIKLHNDLYEFAESLISSSGLDYSYFETVCYLIEKQYEIDSNTDLFYGVFLHLIDPIHLFALIRQRSNFKDKMIPFLINHIGSSYFLVTQRLAEVITKFKEDIDFQFWVIKYSKNIYKDLKNQDS